jgi:hypothetical protein
MNDKEDRADRFYASLAWVGNQAELVTYLLSRHHPVLAHSAIQGVLSHIGQFPAWDAAQLQQAYLARRRETKKRYDEAVK